jgi:hypothetical protein
VGGARDEGEIPSPLRTGGNFLISGTRFLWGEGSSVTSLILLVCKNVEFQKMDLNFSAYEIIKDVFLFPFPKVLDFYLFQSIILGLIEC